MEIKLTLISIICFFSSFFSSFYFFFSLFIPIFQDKIEGYECLCVLGWTGVNCDENINERLSDPCQQGGNCMDVINGYYTALAQWSMKWVEVIDSCHHINFAYFPNCVTGS